MKGTPLKALAALLLAGAAALFAVKARDRRRALTVGSMGSDPPDETLDEGNMGDLATGEGMPEVG